MAQTWLVCLRRSYHRVISPSFKASSPRQKQTLTESTNIRTADLTMASHQWQEGQNLTRILVLWQVPLCRPVLRKGSEGVKKSCCSGGL